MERVGTVQVFEADDPALLPGLLAEAARGRHDLLLAAEATADWSQWLAEQPPVMQEAWTRCVRDSNVRQALAWSDLEVEVADLAESDWSASPPRLRLHDAGELLRNALEVLVEDETSDGAFLDAVVPPPIKSAWTQARELRLVRLMTIGGVTNLKRRLAGDRIRPPLSLRTFVLIDSDAPAPWRDAHGTLKESVSELPKETRKAAEEALKKNIPIHVLARRMAENYLPPATLRQWASTLGKGALLEKGPHVEAFGGLSRERQHHHHLKSGERADSDRYADLAIELRKALSKPLGNDLWRAFDRADEDELAAYEVHSELTPLFQTLLRLI